MKVYLSSDGSILQSTPSVIGRGSTVVDFEVEAPFSAAIIAVRFGLRSGTTQPLVLTRRTFASDINRHLWSAKIPFAVSQYSGSIPYTIELLDGDGCTIASPQGSITVSPGTVPTIPSDPPADAWTAIQQYLTEVLAVAETGSADLRDLMARIENGEFDGKSAYAYAKEGGYTGTETEFAEALAKAVEEVTYTVEVEVI